MSNEVEKQILKVLNQPESEPSQDAHVERVEINRFSNEKDNVISESSERIYLDDRGVLKSKKDEVHNLNFLADGTSLNKLGLEKCQTCKEIVSKSNISRCWCGKTCCLARCCGRTFTSNGKLCCSRWHAFRAWIGLTARW